MLPTPYSIVSNHCSVGQLRRHSGAPGDADQGLALIFDFMSLPCAQAGALAALRKLIAHADGKVVEQAGDLSGRFSLASTGSCKPEALEAVAALITLDRDDEA